MCSFKRILALSFFFLLLAGSCFAGTDPETARQQFTFHTFTDRDGLPQNSIMAMAFDQRSYLWIATQDGAAYYNGRKWTVVDMPDRTVSNFVRAILVASDGSIWFGRQDGGLARLKDNQWTIFNTSSGLPSNWVNKILETTGPDGKHVLWIGTLGGLARFEDGKWTVYNTKSGLPSNEVWNLLETVEKDGSRALWVGTVGGLACLENGKWTVYNTYSGLPSNTVWSLLETVEDGTHTLWAGTLGGLARFEKGRWTTYDTDLGLPNNSVEALLETKSLDGKRSIWVATFGGGLAQLENGKWTSYDSRSGLPGNIVLSLFEGISRNGAHTLWVGTFGGGLACMEFGKWVTYDTDSGLPNKRVNSLLETRAENGSNIIWAATNAGLARLENGRWTAYDSSSGLQSKVIRSLTESISKDGGRAIWLGTDNGVVRFENGKWTTIDTTKGLPSNLVYSLLETRSENGTPTLWVGTYNSGVARLEDGKWTVYDMNTGLPGNTVWSLLETRSRNGSHIIWAGTSGGLARLEKGKWTVYDSKTGLPNSSVLSLHESTTADGRHWLWVGTFGGGVARLDLDSETPRWTTLSDTTTPALPNNVINSICEDKENRIYLFTNKGIARLTPRSPTADNPAEFQIFTFTTGDGLPSNETKPGAAMVDSSGHIWAGTVGGLAVLDPSKEVEDHSQKPLYIEHMLVADKETGLPRADSPLRLAYNHNDIWFEYVLLSYYREADTRYRTQLEGLEDEPTEWSTDYHTVYNYLPEGKYVFKVWGRDYAGNVTGPLEVPFSVKPAPWRTWWAYLFYGAIVVGAGYGGVRYRLEALRRRNEALEVKVEKRTEELAEKVKELARKNEELIQSHKRADQIFSALSDVLPGTVLEEKYRIESKIGSGGFGTVYKAIHTSLNRPVAVKIFRPAAGNATIESLERFRLEGVSTCRVNHPNAVSVLDSGVSSSGIAYLVMELLEGHPLSDELQEKGALSLERAAEIIVPVCDVLEEAHRSGIIHRDIKPDNIFLNQTRSGEMVKVVDFGIAKLMGETGGVDVQSLTAAGGLLGTPAYMSPERLDDKPYDGRADVYSVGMMLYQMLCGRLPFQGEDGNLWSVVFMHLTKDPPPPREFNPNIPEEVEAVIMRSLEKDPEKRQTAIEFAQEFTKAAGIELEMLSSGTFRLATSSHVTTTPTVETGPQNTATIKKDTGEVKKTITNPAE